MARIIKTGSAGKDRLLLEKGIVIEVDGGHHNERSTYDAKRDDYLRAQGLVVLRFWDHEVLRQIDDVKEAIWKSVTGSPLLDPPPKRGRRC